MLIVQVHANVIRKKKKKKKKRRNMTMKEISVKFQMRITILHQKVVLYPIVEKLITSQILGGCLDCNSKNPK
jgi:hypothetical protein